MAEPIIIEGVDWEGNPTERQIVPGIRVALRGKFGEGFDIRGPHASMCQECSEILRSETAGSMTGIIQSHYAENHGFTPSIL